MKKFLLCSLVLMGLSSFAGDFVGPNYEINSHAGFAAELLPPLVGANVGVELIPNWEKKLNDKWSVKIGPVVGVHGSVGVPYIVLIPVYRVSTEVGFSYTFDMKLDDKNNKFYIGQIVSGGVQFPILVTGSSRIRMGVRYNDNTHVGGYIGLGNGIIGVEVGHTF